jgi:hypothetical protein
LPSSLSTLITTMCGVQANHQPTFLVGSDVLECWFMDYVTSKNV